MNNYQWFFLLLFFALLLIIIPYNLGMDIAINHEKLFPSFFRKTNLYYKNEFDSKFKLVKYKNLNSFMYIENPDKPTLILFNLNINKGRLTNFTKNNYFNIIDFKPNTYSFKPNFSYKRYLETFKSIVKDYKLSNVHIYGLCACVDLACYIAQNTPDITKSLILDIPILNFDTAIDKTTKTKFLKKIVRDTFTITNNNKVNQDILLLTTISEKKCELSEILQKTKSIKTHFKLKIFKDNYNNYFHYEHADSYNYQQFDKIINDFIHKKFDKKLETRLKRL